MRDYQLKVEPFAYVALQNVEIHSSPTREECTEVEIDYMLEELRTTYKDVIETGESDEK